MGRPAKYNSPDEIQSAIDKYWEQAGDKPTITGLALFLGFESRQSFYKYEKDGEFCYIIKKARLHVESIYESKLHSNNAAGPIFALKNFGWSDKQEVEHSGKVTLNFSPDYEKL